MSGANPPLPTLRDRFLTAWRRRGWRGAHTLQRIIPGARPDDALLVETTYRSRFLLNPLAHIDAVVIAEGFYESEVIEALRPHLHPGAVLWDIGANFGLIAATAGQLGAVATIVAFEPNPVEHARLLRHCAWNAPHVITSTVALSDTTGILPLHLGPEGNSGMTTLSPWFKASASGEIMVAVSTGDELVARSTVPAPTVIKLDVEGHEPAVLRGLSATLAAPRCEVVVFEDHAADDSEAKQLLRTAGFTLAALDRRERSAHALVNFIARKS